VRGSGGFTVLRTPSLRWQVLRLSLWQRLPDGGSRELGCYKKPVRELHR
jgi:hypothetical protein